ncbi:hypothetical protein APHDU1_0293 [Anaplasma phagocytophilum]|nr:hypothetical protein APHDU1_0293 [Anaplasma phagocytophilum]
MDGLLHLCALRKERAVFSAWCKLRNRRYYLTYYDYVTSRPDRDTLAHVLVLQLRFSYVKTDPVSNT